ncbi:MAG TPA: hypothetical protein VNM16_10085 [Bacillota bacterium]|nr:hypothetical protein [Bacillota bacterium]
MIRRVGAGLVPYAAAAAGVVGFGLLYRGVAAGSLPLALTGLALILLGLDRAGRALAASIMLHAEMGRRTGAGAGAGSDADAGTEMAQGAKNRDTGTMASRATPPASRMRRPQQHGPRRDSGRQDINQRD